MSNDTTEQVLIRQMALTFYQMVQDNPALSEAQKEEIKALRRKIKRERDPELKERFERAKRTIDTITTLNKAGRRYLGTARRNCIAAGVNVLAQVSDDLDCLFYHLREHPSLCE